MKISKKQLNRLIEGLVKEQLEEQTTDNENMNTVRVMKELLFRLRTYADRLTSPGETTMHPGTAKDIHKYLEEIEGWLEGYEAVIDSDTFWNRLDSPYRPPEK